MSRIKDLSSMKFGRLSVISRADNSKSGKAMWKCRCDCGNKVIVDGYSLRSGNTKSCGCLQREIVISKNTKHGKSKTQLYRVYRHMKERCFSEADKRFPDYGGRGITICDEWLGRDGFQNFYEWSLRNGYANDLSIDRKDVDGNYCPENCRWVNMKVQQNNRRNNHILEYKGESKTLSEWSAVTGIKSLTILNRLKLGWSVEKALTEPVRR